MSQDPRERKHEQAAQKVREARQHLADIPIKERSAGDYIGLLLLGIAEEVLSLRRDE